MSTEEDTELRDLVIESLEKKGILDKIKAELRATVFLALEETNLEKCKISFQNEALKEYLETMEGKVVVGLVKDFLKVFKLDYTLAVFEPEVSTDRKLMSREDLATKLNIKVDSAPQDRPLISMLLKMSEKSTESKPSLQNEILIDSSSAEKISKSLNQEIPAQSDSLEDSNNSDGNDNFFDTPLPSNQKEPLLFSFLGKNDLKAEKLSTAESNPNQKSPDQIGDLTFSKIDNKSISFDNVKPNPANKTTEKPKETSVLSSLRDLPSLMQQSAPKIQSKADDFYDDDFQSSKSLKSAENKDQDDTEVSIEESIEEDISVAANDIFNSLTSPDVDVTFDHSISQLSGGEGYDYMEKIS